MGGKRKLAAAAKQLEQAQSRIAELSRYIKRLYEDNVNGKISDERFMEMSADYEAEQRELKDRAAALQDELDKAQEATVNAEKFMSIVRKYLSIEELTHCEFQSNGAPVPKERCAHSNANGVAVPFQTA